MDPTLLVTDQVEGGRKLLERLTADGVELSAAFWARADEDDRWRLHIATPEYDRDTTGETYTRVSRALAGCRWDNSREAIDPLAVYLHGTIDPFVTGVTGVLDSYPGLRRANVWYRTVWTGTVALDGVYFYALPHPAPVPAG